MSKATRIAEKLAADWRARRDCGWLSGPFAPASIEEAYEAQGEYQRIIQSDRGRIVGRKIALSSKPMQELCGIDHPLAGAVFEKEVYHSPAEIEVAGYIHLGLEFELAMELGRDVEPGSHYDAKSVLDVVECMRPAFEMIEDRGADYSEIDVMTIISDNAWAGGIVLGEKLENWRELNLNDMVSVCSQNGMPDETGNTGAADPFGSLAWVLNHFSRRGETIRRGEQIITGSVIHTRFPKPGTRVTYKVGNAEVEAKFV